MSEKFDFKLSIDGDQQVEIEVSADNVTLEEMVKMVTFHLARLEPETEDDTNIDSNDQNAEELASEVREEEERDFDCCSTEQPHTGINIEQHIYGPATKVVVTEEYEYDGSGALAKKITTTGGTAGIHG